MNNKTSRQVFSLVFINREGKSTKDFSFADFKV